MWWKITGWFRVNRKVWASRIWSYIVLLWHVLLGITFLYHEDGYGASGFGAFIGMHEFQIVFWLFILYGLYCISIGIQEKPFTFSGSAPFIAIIISISMIFDGGKTGDIAKFTSGAFFFMSSLNLLTSMMNYSSYKSDKNKKLEAVKKMLDDEDYRILIRAELELRQMKSDLGLKNKSEEEKKELKQKIESQEDLMKWYVNPPDRMYGLYNRR